MFFYSKLEKLFYLDDFIEGKVSLMQKIIEKFHRNEEVVADRDIARREFDISNEEINLNYHYAEGKITAGTRYFVKPPVTEQGDRLKFDSKLTSGYVVSV